MTASTIFLTTLSPYFVVVVAKIKQTAAKLNKQDHSPTAKINIVVLSVIGRKNYNSMFNW